VDCFPIILFDIFCLVIVVIKVCQVSATVQKCNIWHEICKNNGDNMINWHFCFNFIHVVNPKWYIYGVGNRISKRPVKALHYSVQVKFVR